MTSRLNPYINFKDNARQAMEFYKEVFGGDLAGGGPTPGFGGMLEGDPVAEAGAHLTEDAAQRAWQEGLAMSVPEAVSVVTGPR